MKPRAYDLAFIQHFPRSNEVPAVRPEILAAKLQAIRDLKYPNLLQQMESEPRLVELLLFIQAMSMRPGGLVQFTKDFLAQFPEQLRTAAMVEIGHPREGHYRLEHCLAIWASLPLRPRSLEWTQDASLFEQLLNEELRMIRRVEQHKTPRANEIIEALTPEFFWRLCVKAALESLPDYLAALCNEQDKGFVLEDKPDYLGRVEPARFENGIFEENTLASWLSHIPRRKHLWYFDGLVPALVEMMERHAAQVGHGLAQTAVTKRVFRELDFAWSQKVPVAIVGDSRFGKTKSVSVWCDMHPGRARLVTVPDSNRERDFFKAHADALGITFSDTTPTARLKDTVEYVLRHTGLACVYDESHFLIPVNFIRTTPPKRLNWIRCQVIDRGLPCAFFATPQTYRQTLGQFVKVTGYNLEQWLGRLPPTVLLPSELEREDLLAVARIHFPDIDPLFLKLIAAKAMQSEGYLKNLEFAAKRARFIAQSQNRAMVTRQDVEAAIQDMLPAAAPTAQRPTKRPAEKASATIMQRTCTPAENGLPPSRGGLGENRFSTAREPSEALPATNRLDASLVAAWC